MERLDKFLCGDGSLTRSQAREKIKQGRVTVDGAAETDPGRKIDPQRQTVRLDGAEIGGQRRVVLMLNKPAGYVTATEDSREQTVMALLPENYRRMGVKPVGRLDKDTEGLLLFTNDGALLHSLISPRRGIPKVYYAQHDGCAGAADAAAFAQGLTLGDGTVCRSAVLERLGEGESLITICEGKYHQVRRMMASRGMCVTYLERRQEGRLTLSGLPRGAVRELTEAELQTLEEDVT